MWLQTDFVPGQRAQITLACSRKLRITRPYARQPCSWKPRVQRVPFAGFIDPPGASDSADEWRSYLSALDKIEPRCSVIQSAIEEALDHLSAFEPVSQGPG